MQFPIIPVENLQVRKRYNFTSPLRPPGYRFEGTFIRTIPPSLNTPTQYQFYNVYEFNADGKSMPWGEVSTIPGQLANIFEVDSNEMPARLHYGDFPKIGGKSRKSNRRNRKSKRRRNRKSKRRR